MRIRSLEAEMDDTSMSMRLHSGLLLKDIPSRNLLSPLAWTTVTPALVENRKVCDDNYRENRICPIIH